MSQIIPIDITSSGPRGAAADAAPRPARPAGNRRVYVLFTDVEGTLRAVRAARDLVPPPDGRVTVVHLRPLDFGAPLDDPPGISPAETDAFCDRLGDEGLDGAVDVRVCVCRDARLALTSVIDPHSLVLVGGHHRWWPTGADRWRRRLETAGHLVVFVDEAPRG